MLIIDNYDSFTYNIVQYIKILGINPIVIKNDEMSLDEIKALSFSRIILSPGWGNPDNSGVTMDVIDYYQDKLPILGVCLGMQCIAKYFGAEIIKLQEPCHGKNSEIFFDTRFKLFKGLNQGFSATRYHSLGVNVFGWNKDYKTKVKEGVGVNVFSWDKDYKTKVNPSNDTISPSLIEITACTEDNIPMALQIKGKEIYGVQFHPEAILTENGIEIFKNFIS